METSRNMQETLYESTCSQADYKSEGSESIIEICAISHSGNRIMACSELHGDMQSAAEMSAPVETYA